MRDPACPACALGLRPKAVYPVRMADGSVLMASEALFLRMTRPGPLARASRFLSRLFRRLPRPFRGAAGRTP